MGKYITEMERLKNTKWNYIRDIWTLGPPQNGYPGAFPKGFINKIKSNGWWGEKRLWLFSGSHKDEGGTTVDINPDLKPDIIANCEQLPFEDESFDFVCLDPPYSEKESKEMYDLPYYNIIKVINEAARVCKINGYILFLHRIIPWYHPNENLHKKKLKIIGIIGIYTLAGYSNLRALSVWQKLKNKT